MAVEFIGAMCLWLGGGLFAYFHARANFKLGQ